MHYVYVLGNSEFLENCNKYIKDKRLALSTTNDVELFKGQITKTNKKDFFIVIDSDKIGTYNKNFIFFGRNLITYKWLKNTNINPENFISFDIEKYKDIEKRILSVIENEDNTEISVPENTLIKKEIPIRDTDEEELEEEIDFDVDTLIDEADKISDFDQTDIENAVSAVVDTHTSTLDLKDVEITKKSKPAAFSSKKVEIRGPDVDIDDGKVSEDDLDDLIAQFNNPQKEDTKKAVQKNTVGQRLVETLGEDQAYDAFKNNEL